jgi:hypothetical protein
MVKWNKDGYANMKEKLAEQEEEEEVKRAEE